MRRARRSVIVTPKPKIERPLCTSPFSLWTCSRKKIVASRECDGPCDRGRFGRRSRMEHRPEISGSGVHDCQVVICRERARHQFRKQKAEAQNSEQPAVDRYRSINDQSRFGRFWMRRRGDVATGRFDPTAFSIAAFGCGREFSARPTELRFGSVGGAMSRLTYSTSSGGGTSLVSGRTASRFCELAH